MTTNQAAAKPKMSRRAVVVATMALFVCSLYHGWKSLSSPEVNWTENSSLRGRSLSVVNLPADSHGCRARNELKLRLSKAITSPTYLASFHVGGKVVSNVVQALTGLATTTQVNYSKRRIDHTVLFETHYPLHRALKLDDDDNFRGTILLLRNPISDILSSFNAFYARQYHYLTDLRAPEGDWIRYRDSAQLSAQIKTYEKFVTYWMTKYEDNREDLLLITYEGLTGGKGARFTKQIGNFLDKSRGVRINPNSIPCVWEQYVHERWHDDEDDGEDSSPTNAHHSFQERFDDRPFTQDQLRPVRRMLQNLDEKFGHDEQFSTIMKSYMNSLS